MMTKRVRFKYLGEGKPLPLGGDALDLKSCHMCGVADAEWFRSADGIFLCESCYYKSIENMKENAR